MRKKLDYFQIQEVFSSLPATKEEASRGQAGVMKRMLPLHDSLGELPEGFYHATRTGIDLPKRKKGERFVVRYTTIHQVEL
jgi:hypothetical protein